MKQLGFIIALIVIFIAYYVKSTDSAPFYH